MKSTLALLPWLSLVLTILSLSGSEARPTSSQHTDTSASADEQLDFFAITPERLTRSMPRQADGFQAMLERRYQRQKARAARSAERSERATQLRQASRTGLDGGSWASKVLGTVREGLSFQPGVASGIADMLDYLSIDTALGTSGSDAHNISEPTFYNQPLDHFDNTTQARFDQRFYYSTRHYVPASQRKAGEVVPIYILDSGEADASERIPYLDKGILDILSQATGGIGIILEHRYYGTSTPNRTDLGPGESWGVDQLRWLTNKQALEDSAEFIRHLKIPGTDNSEARKVIYYGGSYPGARSAHMRLLYPELVHGAIASSAVTAAVDEFPEYFYPVARGAPTNCSQAIQAAVAGIDRIIAPNPRTGGNQPDRDANKTAALLDLFGLKGLTNLADLANLNTYPLGSFQSLNWDPEWSSDEFGKFCDVLTTYGVKGYDAGSESQNAVDAGLDVSREVHAYAKYMRDNYAKPCVEGEDGEPGSTPDACFGTNYEKFANTKRLSAGKAWTFQYCSTWGYIMTAPPVPEAKTAADGSRYFVSSGPKLVSTLLDYAYAHEICEKGFPAGEHYTMPARPDIDEVNKLGGFELEFDRLAFVDGQYDPWRPATVHSEEFAYGGNRPDTLQKPFKLIPDCWHHCDENGVKDPAKTPERVRLIHQQQIAFVKEWLKQD